MAAPICVPHRKNPDKTDPVQMAYTAPEKEGGKVLGVVAVEQKRASADPNLRQFVDGSDDHQLSTAIGLHHTARTLLLLTAVQLAHTNTRA